MIHPISFPGHHHHNYYWYHNVALALKSFNNVPVLCVLMYMVLSITV